MCFMIPVMSDYICATAVSHCSYNGQLYPVGQVVTNCEDQCTCTATGHMNCTSLCPDSSLPDVPEGCTLMFENGCSCTATISCPYQISSAQPESVSGMAQESCEYKGNNYTEGATWTDTTNCTTCTCEAGHVACIVSCQEPEIPEGCVNPQRRTEENSCCPLIICDNNTDSVEGEEWCRHNGSVHRAGSSFTQGCSLCVCGHHGLINCTFTSCPVLELPVPSLLCPAPQVRMDGCCDTVYCTAEHPDPQAMLSRLMALSFGPNTLTISFEVDHVTSTSPTVIQDRYEVMTSDGQGGAESWTSRTYTPRTLDVDDNVSSPSDLLHADSAIHVDGRVFITLDSLRPNTTYYIRVEPVTKRDMGVTEDYRFNSTLTGIFVAKTMAKVTTCMVGDMELQDGDITSSDCREVCRCIRGDVICQPTCPEEGVEGGLVRAPSVSCPQPRQVPSAHSPCCHSWRCFPQDDGCVYKGIILNNDEFVYEGACGQKCKCTQGEVTCTPVCPSVTSAPRAGCILSNVTDNCCPVWMCPAERVPALELYLASHITLQGPCSQDNTFKTLMSTVFQKQVQGHLPCADRGSSMFVECWVKDIVVICLDDRTHPRETVQLGMVTVIAANISEMNDETKIQASLNQTNRALFAMFMADGLHLSLGNGVTVTSSGHFQSLGVSAVCPVGFLYQHTACVPQYLYSPVRQLQQNILLSVTAISAHTATLLWPSLAHSSHPYVTAVIIEVQETSSSEQNRTLLLDPMTTNYTLSNLTASQGYIVRLMTLSISTASVRTLLSMASFTTAGHEVLTSAFTLHSMQVMLDETSVTLSWTPYPNDIMRAIASLKVTWHRNPTELEQDGQWLDVDPFASEVTLTGLESGQTYVIKFVISLVNGTTLTLIPLHLVTKTAGRLEGPVVAVLATCAVMVLLSILTPVLFFMWRRAHRKTTTDATAFENKTFGANITSLCDTRAKNDNAQPQAPDGGGTAACSMPECPQQA